MLRSRILLNIALLALVVMLGIFVFYDNDAVESHQLSTMDADTIDSIEIQHRDRYVVLKKINDKWRMTRPINIEANSIRIGSLLKFINTTTHASYDTTTMELSRFKLDNPRTTIRFSGSDVDKLFEFGSANPINRLRYVKVDERLNLIDDNFYPLVSSQIGTLISPSLLPGIDTITSLRLPDIQITRSSEGRWQLSPEDDSLSADDINELVDRWQHAQAFGVHDYLQRENLGEIDITALANGEPVRASFIVTDIDPWLIIARPKLGIEYHLDGEAYDSLLRPGNSLPDGIDPAEVDLDPATN